MKKHISITKKTFAAVITLCIAMTGTAAYGEPAQDPAADWKSQYTAFIQNLGTDTAVCQAALIYLDADDIPELILHRDGQDPDCLIHINDGKVQSDDLDCKPEGYGVFNDTWINSAHMYSQYLEKDGLLYISFNHGAAADFYIFKLENGVLSEEIVYDTTDQSKDFTVMLGRMNALYDESKPNNRMLDGDEFNGFDALIGYINDFSGDASQYLGLYQVVPYPEGTVVSIMSNPDDYSSVLGQASSGQIMDVLSENGYGWGQIDYNGTTGWIKLHDTQIKGSYKVETPASGFVTPAKYIIVNTEGEGLELRTAPTTDAPTFGPMYDGTVVTVTATQGSWAYVDNNGINGWSHMNYMQYYGAASPDTGNVPGASGDFSQLVGSWYGFGSDYLPSTVSDRIWATFFEDGYLDLSGTTYKYEFSNQYPFYNIVATRVSGNGNDIMLFNFDPSKPNWMSVNTPPVNGFYAASGYVGRYPCAGDCQ